MKYFSEPKNKKEKDALRIDWLSRSITKTDWTILKSVLETRDIKKVVEFGSGVSTQLMDKFGVDVCSYETVLLHLERVRLLVCNVTFVLWDGKRPPIFDEDYGLALIDGPRGGESREPAYQSVANSDVPLVACHDYKRVVDNKWIKKYFSNWKEITRSSESIPGLLVLER